MSLFDVSGLILIAVDDKFTLEDEDGIEVHKESIHRQFLDKYYTNESGHKEEIKKAVNDRNKSTEIAIPIGDKIFVLFAYSTQGNISDYKSKSAYRYGFIEITDSIEKALDFCKDNFPGETIYSAPIGAKTQNQYSKGLIYSEVKAENRLKDLANKKRLNLVVIKELRYINARRR